MTEIPAEPQELKHAGRLGSAIQECSSEEELCCPPIPCPNLWLETEQVQFGVHTPPWSQLYLPVHEHYRLITSLELYSSAESQLGCYICDFQKRSGSQQRAMALQGGFLWHTV